MNYRIIFCLILITGLLYSENVYKNVDFIFAILRYGGGGDWYSARGAVRNFLIHLSKWTDLRISLKEKIVDLKTDEIFLYPFIFINGHGNIFFEPDEVLRLRRYLLNGGFLFVNDDYGLDKYFRRELKKVFPDKELVEVPFEHPIYHCYYSFPSGLPKVHKHHGGPPKGYGIFHQGRLVLFYVYDTDIVDGWEEERVHKNPAEIREQALKIGVNIVYYSLLY